jgi:uncharacterized membrane protein YvbJ
MGDLWACLNCGAELEHDWMPCPHCGWKAPGPGEEDAAEPEDGSPQARFHLFSRRTTFLKILAVLLALVFGLLIVNWIWRVL